MIDANDDDSDRAQKIEARLTLTLSEARIDAGLGSLFGNDANLTGAPAQSRKQTLLNEETRCRRVTAIGSGQD